MKPQNKFQLSLKENKDKLINIGYSESTINSWMYGYRKPYFENAIKLSAIDKLGLNLTDIPYRQVIINKP